MFPSLRPTGEVFLPPIPLALAAHERWLAIAFTHADHAILHEIFFRLQVRLRHLHDPHFKIFHNGALLRVPGSGTRGLISLEQGRLIAVAAGAAPRELVARVLAALATLVPSPAALRVSALCP